MENNKKKVAAGSSSSSLTNFDHLFGPKDPSTTSSSSTSIFGSIFPPPSTVCMSPSYFLFLLFIAQSSFHNMSCMFFFLFCFFLCLLFSLYGIVIVSDYLTNRFFREYHTSNVLVFNNKRINFNGLWLQSLRSLIRLSLYVCINSTPFYKVVIESIMVKLFYLGN